MDIIFCDQFGRPAEHEPNNRVSLLLLYGQIRKGDNDKFIAFLRNNAKTIGANPLAFDIFLDSPGGDVEEALKLATSIRVLMGHVFVGLNMTCASSCFLLYVNAPMRSADGKIAIHRPYLAPERVRGLSADDAQKAQERIYADLKKWLQDRLVQQRLIDTLLSSPSSGAYVLSINEIHALGERAPWYEEWLLARCPDVIEARKDGFIPGFGSAEAQERFNKSVYCEMNAIGPEASKGLRSLQNQHQSFGSLID